MLGRGAFPLRSMLGQFLCHASRKTLSLRKALSEKAHRSRGSAEGWLRANGAVRTGSQLPAHWHESAKYRTAGITRVSLPPWSPNLNAYAERLVRSVKEECLARLVLFGEASLRHALTQYVEHF